MTILLVNGPNLALLGTREPGIYGRETLDGIVAAVTARAAAAGMVVRAFQSDIEGELVREIGAARATCAHRPNWPREAGCLRLKSSWTSKPH